jgi:hypothetical protein
VAFLATTILFALAMLAMRTVRMAPLFSTTREEVAPPTIIHFDPPPPKVAPKPRVEPAPARAKPAVPSNVAPSVTPTTIPSVMAPPVVVPIPVTSTPARDSANAASNAAPARRITDLLPTRDIPTFPASAPRTSPAPIAPAGVTSHMKPLTVAERDSIATVQMARLAAELKRPYTEAERRTASAHAEPGAPLPGTRAAGDAPLMNGGANVRIPIASISAPLFTRSPSPVESTEERLRRERLHDRALFLRDSLRADSIAKARIRP